MTMITEVIQSYWITSYYANEDSILYCDGSGYFHFLYHNQNPCNNINGQSNIYYADGDLSHGGCGGHTYCVDPRNTNNKWYFGDPVIRLMQIERYRILE